MMEDHKYIVELKRKLLTTKHLNSSNIVICPTTPLYIVCQCAYNGNLLMFKIKYKDGKHLDHNKIFLYPNKGSRTLGEHIENCGNSMIINHYSRYKLHYQQQCELDTESMSKCCCTTLHCHCNCNCNCNCDVNSVSVNHLVDI